MYTKEVENLKLREIFRLVENIIESNLRLFLTVVAIITVISYVITYFISGDATFFVFGVVLNAVLTLIIKVITLKSIKIENAGNSLITNRAKKGRTGIQVLMYTVFNIVATILATIVVLGMGMLYSTINLANQAIGNLFIIVALIIFIPISIVFSMCVEGIFMEIFCKDEVNKFISNAYNNIFKSKTNTASKLIIGTILLICVSIIISIPTLIAENNYFGTAISSILSSCFVVVSWTYVYVVYMTSITARDLENADNSQNNLNNPNNNTNNTLNNTINNTSSSEEITRLW